METEIGTKTSERQQLGSNSDLSSDTDSDIKSSSSGDSDSDSSLDSEDVNLDTMSSSQFLILPKGDSDSIKFETLETIGPLEDDDTTPTSSVCISSISSSVVSAVSQTLEKAAPAVRTKPEIEMSYARDPYSPSSISHLLPSHLKEDQFVTVEEGDALVVLQELTDYLWIVKVCRTESIGIIPAWNVEGEFERIARINMELNARVSTPVAEFPPTDSTSSSSEDDLPTTPSSTTDDASPFRDSLRPTKVRKLRSVDFAASQQKVMFRYPSERYVSGEWEQSPPPATPIPASWYHGWIEGEEGEEVPVTFVAIPPPVEPVPVKQKTCRRGRKRNRKRVSLTH